MGCQGEGCDCFNDYKDAVAEKKTKDFDIATIRPFKLYKGMDTKSALLGTYQPGVKARPLSQKIVIVEPGVLRVTGDNKKLGVKKWDTLSSELNLGEGSMTARIKGKWITYDYSSLSTVEVKKSVIEDWTKVSVGKNSGFTVDHPFEGCLP